MWQTYEVALDADATPGQMQTSAPMSGGARQIQPLVPVHPEPFEGESVIQGQACARHCKEEQVHDAVPVDAAATNARRW